MSNERSEKNSLSETIPVLPERVEFENSRGLNLVGDLYRADSSSVIVISHGLSGDRTEHGRFGLLSEALQKAGYNVLTYDFSGCGESDDDPITEAKEIDDIKSALKFADNQGLKHVSLMGLSFGGLVTLRGYNDDVEAIALWSPVTDAAYDPEEYYGEEGQRELREKGTITRHRPGTVRLDTVIDGQLFKDWRSIDQEELLRPIKRPVLIVQGTADERIPMEHSEAAIKLLPEGSKLVKVPGADHSFANDVPFFIQQAVDWFVQHAPPAT